MILDNHNVNIWEIEDYVIDAIVVPTNGTLREKTDHAVCGAGMALEAQVRDTNFERRLGRYIKLYGNHVFPVVYYQRKALVAFPTKHNWWDKKSDIELIEQSCKELVTISKIHDWRRIVLPRVGCGCGGLDWDTVVRPVCEKILDSRFMLVG